jgi:hypothetical protein
VGGGIQGPLGTVATNRPIVPDLRQIEIHTAELLVPDPSPFYVEIAIAK